MPLAGWPLRAPAVVDGMRASDLPPESVSSDEGGRGRPFGIAREGVSKFLEDTTS